MCHIDVFNSSTSFVLSKGNPNAAGAWVLRLDSKGRGVMGRLCSYYVCRKECSMTIPGSLLISSSFAARKVCRLGNLTGTCEVGSEPMCVSFRVDFIASEPCQIKI